jgi:4-hydroxybenzoate polyprenyltransferase
MTDGPRRGPLAQVGAFLRDIRLEHSLFALPFALIGALLVCQALVYRGIRSLPYPSRHELAWLVLAMVGARTAAMGFNRVVDRGLDARNPRTAGRALASGRAGLAAYVGCIAAGLGLLYAAAWHFNPLAVKLAPLAVFVLFFYSLTKRFTVLCHWFLGLALGISPLAAWVALGDGYPRSPSPYLLCALVILWVAGFDIIYATLDIDFDRAHGIHSIPAWLGVERGLWVARLCHLGMLLCLAGFFVFSPPGLGKGFGACALIAAALLIYEHAIVRPDDLGRVNTAFFTVNAVLGLLLLAGAVIDWVVRLPLPH